MDKIQYSLIKFITNQRKIEQLVQLQFLYDANCEIHKNCKEASTVPEIRDALISNTINNLIEESSELFNNFMQDLKLRYVYNHSFDFLTLVRDKNQELYIVAGKDYILKEGEECVISTRQEDLYEFLKMSTILIHSKKEETKIRRIK